MNEQELKKLEDQLAKLGTDIDAKLKAESEKYVNASKEVKDSIKKEVEPLLKQYGELNEKLLKAQGQLDALDVKLQRLPFGTPTAKKNFKDATLDILNKWRAEAPNGSLKEYISKHKSTGEMLLKVDDMTQGNSFESTSVVQAQHVPGIVFDPDRTARIRDLVSPGTTNSNSIEYVYEYAYTDSTDITAEGSEYKQSDFDLKLATATVRKITAYIIVSEEMLDDVEGLNSYISSRLPSKLKEKEDYQLLYGDNTGTNLNGLATAATDYSDNLADSDISRIDVLVDACRQVADDEYRATFILINPTDATLIKLTKDDNGNYIHPWIFMPNGQIVLDGVPVIVSTAINAGDFLVGDGKLAAQVFDRRQMTLEMTNQNEDNFIKGMVTVRISERITQAVYRAKALIYGSFGSALAQGSA